MCVRLRYVHCVLVVDQYGVFKCQISRAGYYICNIMRQNVKEDKEPKQTCYNVVVFFKCQIYIVLNVY